MGGGGGREGRGIRSNVQVEASVKNYRWQQEYEEKICLQHCRLQNIQHGTRAVSKCNDFDGPEVNTRLPINLIGM